MALTQNVAANGNVTPPVDRRRRFVVSAAHDDDDDDDDDTCIAESHLTPTDQAIVARNAVRICHSVNVSFLY